MQCRVYSASVLAPHCGFQRAEAQLGGVSVWHPPTSSPGLASCMIIYHWLFWNLLLPLDLYKFHAIYWSISPDSLWGCTAKSSTSKLGPWKGVQESSSYTRHNPHFLGDRTWKHNYHSLNQLIMPVDKIRVSGDSRIEYKTATLNGHNYCEHTTPQRRAYTQCLLYGFNMNWLTICSLHSQPA